MSDELERQCKAITASGSQCRRSAKDGSDYCGIHDNIIGDIESAKEEIDLELPRVRQIVRYINKQGVFGSTGSWPREAIDNYLDVWLKKGYKLMNSHYLGENPEGFGVLYVLILDD